MCTNDHWCVLMLMAVHEYVLMLVPSTNIYECKLIWENEPICIPAYRYVLIYTNAYSWVLKCNGVHWYILRATNICWYVIISTDVADAHWYALLPCMNMHLCSLMRTDAYFMCTYQVCTPVSMHNDVYGYLLMCTHVYKCVPMCTDVFECASMQGSMALCHQASWPSQAW